MRRFGIAVFAALFATAGFVAAPGQSAAAAVSTKIVVVVGNVAGMESQFINAGQSFATEARRYTSNVVTLITPNASWSAVSAALQGANIVYYAGHGNGQPSPYHTALVPSSTDMKSVDGFGIDPVSSGKVTYYGESYFRSDVRLAPNAIVILNMACYSAGNSEPQNAPGSFDQAQHRADNFAAGFISAGAKAVIAEAHGDANWYLGQLFNAHSTIDAVWRSYPSFHNNVKSFASARSAGFTAQMDPCTSSCSSNGDVYFRSLVSIPATKTDDIVGSVPVERLGLYHPITPTRILDTRKGIGLSGKFNDKIVRRFSVVGRAGIPTGTVAVTGNVTVAHQTAPGYVYLAPSIAGARPGATLYFPVGVMRASGMTVPLANDGTLSAIYVGYSGSSTDLIFDVTGYYAPGSGAGYNAFTPTRLVDTTANLGLTGKLPTSQPRQVKIAGVQGLPASGVVAITGNLTVLHNNAIGYVYIGPNQTNTCTTQSINAVLNDTIANTFTVPVGSDGNVWVVWKGEVAGSSTDLYLDVTGYYTGTGGAAYHPIGPVKILDSRVPVGVSSRFSAGTAQTFAAVTTASQIPAGSAAVTGSFSSFQQTAAGRASLGRDPATVGQLADLYFPASDLRANGVTVPLTTDGKMSGTYVAPSGATTILIYFVTGYFK